MRNEGYTHLEGVTRPEVDGDKRQPNDASRVHREPDEFSLVEVLRHFPGLHGVEGADGDEYHVVHLEKMNSQFICGQHFIVVDCPFAAITRRFDLYLLFPSLPER